jgi:hypothetical protein
MRKQVGSSGRTERHTFAGAALRGPKPSDGLAAAVVAEEEERGGSQTRNRGAGGARHEAEDMGGVAVWVRCDSWLEPLDQSRCHFFFAALLALTHEKCYSYLHCYVTAHKYWYDNDYIGPRLYRASVRTDRPALPSCAARLRPTLPRCFFH